MDMGSAGSPSGYLRIEGVGLPITSVRVTPTGLVLRATGPARRASAHGPVQVLTADMQLAWEGADLRGWNDAGPGDVVTIDYFLSIASLQVADGTVSAR